MKTDIEFFGEAFETDYEGDTPWYTVRFQAPYTPSKQSKIDDLFMSVPFLSILWSSRQLCTLECELTPQELQDWDNNRLVVRSQIDTVHATYPIEAVAFYDEANLAE